MNSDASDTTPIDDETELRDSQETTPISDDDFEKAFRNKHPIWWWSALIGPAIISFTILCVYYFVFDLEELRNLGIAIVATFLMLGRFVILLGGEEYQVTDTMVFEMSAESLFIMVTTMDFLVAFFVAFHMGILFRLPFFGPKLEGMVSDGRFILKHQPWIRGVAFFGLVLFVIFPSSTTGSIGGSIFGRLLGMRRFRVVIAILIGSILGNGLMYFLAGWMNQYMSSDSILLKIIGIGSMVVALVVVERYFRKMKAKYLKVEADEAKLKNEISDE